MTSFDTSGGSLSDNSTNPPGGWITELGRLMPAPAFPADYPHSAKGPIDYSRYEFGLEASLSRRLMQMVETDEYSVFTMLVSFLGILTTKWTSNSSVVFNIPPVLQGHDISSVCDVTPVFFACDPHATVKEVLDRSARAIEDVQSRQAVTIFKLVELLGLEFSDVRCPVADIGIEMKGMFQEFDLVEFPVDTLFSFTVESREITCSVLYKSDLYEARTIQSIASHLQNIVAFALGALDARIADVDFMSSSERHDLALIAKGATVDFPLDRTFHGLFEEQAGRTPDKLAVVCGQSRLTYQELDQYSNRIANTLLGAGLRKGEFVVILLPRDIDFLAVMLGIFKAGGAYVPVDPAYPEDRVTYMLTDSRARFAFSSMATANHFSPAFSKSASIECIILLGDEISSEVADADWARTRLMSPAAVASADSGSPGIAGNGSDLAYMIYTSGSTGKPKGAICRHDGALNHLYGELHGLGISGSFSFLQSAASSSDISVWQFLGPVLSGGASIIIDHAVVVDPVRLLDVINAEQIDLVELVPVVLREFINYVSRIPKNERALPHLKAMVATGDALPVDLVNRWFRYYPAIPIANTYGPTEASDDITLLVMKSPLSRRAVSVPIGAPLANLNTIICDTELNMLPVGVPGEICVTGVGVGEGYWQQPEKTAEVFVPNPFPELSGKVLYRTGDLGRWLADGTIEFLGRIDQQVKIRGFRVEPGEIETVLNQHPAIDSSLVQAREDSVGNKRLIAYVVPHEGIPTSASELRGYLKGSLADFMIPSAFVFLEAFPLTPIGKIDRKALPGIEEAEPERREDFIAPRTPTEEKLCEIWAKVLGVPDVSINDNFMEIGGDSILAIQVAIEARARGLPVEPLHVFQYPNIAELAVAADEVMPSVDSRPGSVPEAAGGTRFPLARLEEKHLERLVNAHPDIVDAYELSPTQQGIYVLCVMAPKGSGIYIEQIKCSLVGSLNLEAFSRAWRNVIGQTPTLRTAITRKALVKPIQIIIDDDSFEVDVHDWREMSPGERDKKLAIFLRQDRCAGFDFGKPPLMRVTLLRTDDQVYQMLWTYHHIILDGWSEPLVLKEVFRSYRDIIAGRALHSTQSVPYRNYIAWLQSRTLDDAGAYWQHLMEGFIRPTTLPTDNTSSDSESIPSHAWGEISIPGVELARIQAFARRTRMTYSTVFQCAWGLLISHRAGTDDVVFGSAVSGRQADLEGIERLCGLCISTLPVRMTFQPGDNVRSLMDRLQSQSSRSRAYEYTPLDLIQKRSDVPREMLPIFDTIFVMANYPGNDLSDISGSDVSISGYEYFTMPHYPLTLFVVLGDDLKIRVIYDCKHYDGQFIAGLLADYRACLTALVSDGREEISAVFGSLEKKH